MYAWQAHESGFQIHETARTLKLSRKVLQTAVGVCFGMRQLVEAFRNFQNGALTQHIGHRCESDARPAVPAGSNVTRTSSILSSVGMAIDQPLIKTGAKFDPGNLAALPHELLHTILGNIPCNER